MDFPAWQGQARAARGGRGEDVGSWGRENVRGSHRADARQSVGAVHAAAEWAQGWRVGAAGD